MFSKLFGKQYWVALSFFDNMDRLTQSIVGEENPWGVRPSPFFPEAELDPVFVIVAGSKYLGHIKTHKEKAPAEYWVNSMLGATSVWANWDMGYPVGPFGTDEQYRRAKRGAKKAIVVEIRAPSPRLAAEKALKIAIKDLS